MPSISSSIVELIAFKLEPDGPRYLLLHRTREEKVYPDLWQFITGSVEGKEKAAEAALRELKEETGLSAVSLWVVPYVFSFYNADWDSVNLSPCFAALVQGSEKIILSDEHDDYRWLKYEEAAGELVWPGWKEGLRIVDEFIVKEMAKGGINRLF